MEQVGQLQVPHDPITKIERVIVYPRRDHGAD